MTVFREHAGALMRQLDVALGEIGENIFDRIDVATIAFDRVDFVVGENRLCGAALGGALERLRHAIAQRVDRGPARA